MGDDYKKAYLKIDSISKEPFHINPLVSLRDYHQTLIELYVEIEKIFRKEDESFLEVLALEKNGSEFNVILPGIPVVCGGIIHTVCSENISYQLGAH